MSRGCTAWGLPWVGGSILSAPAPALLQGFVPGQEQCVCLLHPVPGISAFLVLQVEVDVKLHQQIYQLPHALQHALLEEDVHQRVSAVVLDIGVEVVKLGGLGPEQIQQVAEEVKTDVS